MNQIGFSQYVAPAVQPGHGCASLHLYSQRLSPAWQSLSYEVACLLLAPGDERGGKECCREVIARARLCSTCPQSVIYTGLAVITITTLSF